MLKYLLQARVNGGEWKTSSVADTREKAAMAATRVVHRVLRPVHMPKIPRRAGHDRQPTPRTHRPTRRNDPTPRLSKLLVPPPIPPRRSLPVHRHVVTPANSGGNILTTPASVLCYALVREKCRCSRRAGE
jgi:hypothetical protein